jgi:hypothetical protein
MKAKVNLLVLAVLLGWMANSASADLILPYNESVSVIPTSAAQGRAFRIVNTYEGYEKSYAGYFQTHGAEGRGICARSLSTAPDVKTYGGYFYTTGPQGRGVFGWSTGGIEGIGVKGWASNEGDVQNFGGHFCATGLQGIGVYGWAESLSPDAVNYGGFFQADGGQGVGLYAVGGPQGYAGIFEGDIMIAGDDKGIVFPDGSRQTTAANTNSSGCGSLAYDSGWIQLTLPGQSVYLTHDVGGNIDDYVVDLDLKRENNAGTSYLTNKGVGTEYYYDMITTSKVILVGPEDIGVKSSVWIRVRIRLCGSGLSEEPGGESIPIILDM